MVQKGQVALCLEKRAFAKFRMEEVGKAEEWEFLRRKGNFKAEHLAGGVVSSDGNTMNG